MLELEAESEPDDELEEEDAVAAAVNLSAFPQDAMGEPILPHELTEDVDLDEPEEGLAQTIAAADTTCSSIVIEGVELVDLEDKALVALDAIGVMTPLRRRALRNLARLFPLDTVQDVQHAHHQIRQLHEARLEELSVEGKQDAHRQLNHEWL